MPWTGTVSSAPNNCAPTLSPRCWRSSTADSIGTPDKDKLVTLEVTLPKSLRKSVRQEAKRRGISVDEVIIEVLRDRPSR